MSEKLVTLYSAQQIAARVSEMGKQIAREYGDEKIVLVCVLKGSFVFTADLARAINGNVQVEFLGVQSYGADTTSSGVVQITQDLTCPIENEHVLIVEDIVDTGLTISHLLDLLGTRKPASLKIAALLHKLSSHWAWSQWTVSPSSVSTAANGSSPKLQQSLRAVLPQVSTPLTLLLSFVSSLNTLARPC